MPFVDSTSKSYAVPGISPVTVSVVTVGDDSTVLSLRTV